MADIKIGVVASAFNLFLAIKVDIASVTSAFIDFKDPDNNTGTFPAVAILNSKGEDSVMYEVTTSNILIRGIWTFQSFVVSSGKERHGLAVKQVFERQILLIGHTHP